MPLTSTERSQRCRKLQRSTSLAPSVVASKVRRFLLLHPDQALEVDMFMKKLAARVKRCKSLQRPTCEAQTTWESTHPNGVAAEYNEDREA